MSFQPDVIRLLPDSVANQIAAGEVIQRPESVIKELVENSIDAGASNIEIVIKDAGKTLVQVIDDGVGMSTTDARMAFERHATSKIRCADDLFTLHTMGFRGEALPSIAAVSEVEVVSRRECDELGTRLVIRGSHVDSQEPAAASKGTNIKVKNLFYNFVARRRFLKKDSIELSHIVHEFERLALVNNNVSFKFSSNGVLLHSLPRGPLKDRIASLFGKTVSGSLIPIRTETSLVTIDGFISLPEGARQRGQRQFLFVNGRNMRHPYFHRAILSCYENLIAKDAQPHYFINFKVDPDRIDVNVHPQKHEIKFEDEQSIWQILTAVIRDALGRYNAATTLEFNNFDAPDIPVLVNGSDPRTNLGNLSDIPDSDYNPFNLKSGATSVGQTFLNLPGGQDFDRKNVNSRPSNLNQSLNAAASVEGWEEFYKSVLDMPYMSERSRIFQIREKYIVTEVEDGVLLIDQHRAHVNILYNEFCSEVNSGEVSSQSLMFCENLELDSQEKVMLDSSIELIERIGFKIGRDAAGNHVLEGIPGTLGAKNPAVVLKSILSDLAESGVDVEADALKRILLTMARSAAVKGGRALSDSEMQHLVSSLFRLSAPGYTPDGLKVIYRLTDDKLASCFR